MIELTVAAIAGGGLQAALQFLISRRKENRIDMDRITAMLKDDNDRLRDDEQRCKERVDELERKVLSYKGQLMTLQSELDTLKNQFLNFGRNGS